MINMLKIHTSNILEIKHTTADSETPNYIWKNSLKRKKQTANVFYSKDMNEIKNLQKKAINNQIKKQEKKIKKQETELQKLKKIKNTIEIKNTDNEKQCDMF